MNKIKNKSTCGKKGKADCLVTIEPSQRLKVEIESKIEKLFGKQIYTFVNNIIQEKEIETGHFFVQDFGALEWVIRARVECAIDKAT